MRSSSLSSENSESESSPEKESASLPEKKPASPPGGESASPPKSEAKPPTDRGTPSYEKVDPSISILLAEKSPLHLPQIKGIFADFHLTNLTFTGNGFRAISYGKEKKFDLIFVCQTLSDVDGISTIESLHTEGMNTETPIVFTWEGIEKTLLKRATAVGAKAFLQKPFEEIHFRKIFEDLLNKYLVSYDDERERAHEAMKPMVQAADFARNIRLQGDFEAAETAFKNGILELFCGLAEVYLSGGNASYANRVLAQAEKIDPTALTRFKIREETFIARGKEYLSKKWHDGAQVEFKAAITLNESSVSALIGLGEALQGMGKSEASSETYQRAIEAKVMVEDRVLFSHLGALALRNKDFNIALRAFDKAISYFPQNAVNYYNKSLLYVLQKNWEKVTPLLKKALSIQPGMREASMMMQKVEKWKKIPAAPQAAKGD